MARERKLRREKIKVELAILGGGDIVFPLIMAGIVLKAFGFWQALVISFFASLSLLFLFLWARRGKFYPAMPFLTVGCFAGLLLIQILELLKLF